MKRRDHDRHEMYETTVFVCIYIYLTYGVDLIYMFH